jgi:hypothetical protein
MKISSCHEPVKAPGEGSPIDGARAGIESPPNFRHLVALYAEAKLANIPRIMNVLRRALQEIPAWHVAAL